MPVYVKYPDQEHIFSPPRRPVQSAHGSPMNASSLISRLQYLCARAGHWTLVDTWTWTHNEYRLWSPTQTKKFFFRTSATNFSWYQSKLKFYQKSTWLHTYNIELMCKYVTDAHLLPVYSGTAPGWESWQVCVVGLVDMEPTPLQSQFGYLVKTSPSQTSHVLHTNIPYSRIHVLFVLTQRDLRLLDVQGSRLQISVFFHFFVVSLWLFLVERQRLVMKIFSRRPSVKLRRKLASVSTGSALHI